MLHISSGNVQLLSLQIVDTLSLQILLNSHWLFHVSVFGYVFILDRDCRECIPLGVELDAVRGAVGKDESERKGGRPVAVAQDRGSGTAQLWRSLSFVHPTVRSLSWTQINQSGWGLCFAALTFVKLDAELKWQTPHWAILVLWGCYSVLYSVSFVSSYLFVLSVLFAAFSGSKFEISQRTLSVSLSLSGVLLLLNVSSLCFLYVLSDTVEVDGWKISEVLGLLCYMLYIVGLVASYYLLNRNLIGMVMLANDRSRIYLFNASQSQFMQTVTKLSVLISLFTAAVGLYVVIRYHLTMLLFALSGDQSHVMTPPPYVQSRRLRRRTEQGITCRAMDHLRSHHRPRHTLYFPLLPLQSKGTFICIIR